jgi:solute carrier family 30 (zinc transporter), member 9
MAISNTRGFMPVLAALVGNALVTVFKTIVALSSGSSSMFSEAIHSFADTSNQALLLIGVTRSRKKPTSEFGYGFGNERFFWALISACGIFFVGAGVTMYHGIEALRHPEPITIDVITFAVLAVAFVVESLTLWLALRSLSRHFPKKTWAARIELADPSTLAVCLEDGVAVIGVFVAAVSISLSYVTGNPAWDAVGSIVIATLLGLVAVTLIAKNRSYLIGRSIPEDDKEEIMAVLRAEPAIERVIDFKSTVLDIGVYRVKFEVEFNGAALMNEAYQQESLLSEFDNISGDYEAFKRFCVWYADRIPRMIGKKIDDIEMRVRDACPEVRYIDIEIN